MESNLNSIKNVLSGYLFSCMFSFGGGEFFSAAFYFLIVLCFSLNLKAAPLVALTPAQVVEKTLENNVQIKTAIFNYQIAMAEERASQNDLDTNLYISPAYKKSISLPNSTLDRQDVTETTSSTALGLKKKFSSGGGTGEFVYQDLQVSTNSLQATLADSARSALQIKWTQPLLKNAGSMIATLPIQKAQLKKQKYWFELMQTIYKELLDSQTAFWDLYQSNQQIQSDNESLSLARENLKEVQARLRIGKATAVDLIQSQAKLALAEASAYSSQFDFESKQEKLLKSIWPVNSLQLAVILKPVVLDLVPRLPDLAQSEIQFASLPSSQLANTEVSLSKMDLSKARNALFPQLDLGLQYSYAGLAQTPSESRRQITQSTYPSWQISLSFSFPLENLTAKAEHQQVLAAVASKEALKKRELSLLNDRFLDSQRELQKKLQILESMKLRLTQEQQLFAIKKQAFHQGAYKWTDYSKAIDSFNDFKSAFDSQVVSLNIESLKLLAVSGLLNSEAVANFLSKQRLQ